MDVLSDYDYELPEDRIAQRPLENRDESKLLWLHRASGKIEDRRFAEVLDVLRPGDLLIWNDTRVTALRLQGHKPTGGAVEFLLLKEIAEGEYEALVKPAKRLPPGSLVHFGGGLNATVGDRLAEPIVHVSFERFPGWRERLAQNGTVPLPPYIYEPLQDSERYQTVYSSAGGSAAAPTAGLHFTPDLIDRLKGMGVRIASVTLDVSLDTFRPVVDEDLGKHVMHGELCRVSKATAREIEDCQGRIIAVGTTSARTLESFAIGHHRVKAGETNTQIFIRPGYRFQIVDGLFTNFHMPKTTMLMMISALAGHRNIMDAYAHALQHQYRFLSFGDSMLIL